MTNGGRLRLCMSSILVLWTGTRAIATETSGTAPYQGIVDRNVFGLKPAPPPPPPADNTPPPPKITLQGITTFGGKKRALLKAQLPPKPGDQTKGEQSFILAEGQRDGDIEVLEISDKRGDEFVKVNDFGTITNLSFENNGIKTAGAAAPNTQLGPPGANPFGSAGGVRGNSPTRPMRLPPTGAAGSPGGYGGSFTPASYGGTRAPSTYSSASASPTYNPSPAIVTGGTTAGTVALPGLASTPTTTSSQQTVPTDPPISLEQQQLLDAAYTMKNKEAIAKGLMPSIPGSNPLLDGETTSGQTTTPTPTATTPQLPPGAARRYVPQ